MKKGAVILLVIISIVVISVGIIYTMRNNSIQINLKEENSKNSEILGTKTFLFLGDSLMKGNGETYGNAFPEYFQRLTNSQVYNISVGGSTLNKDFSNNIMAQVELAVSLKGQYSDPDCIILDGGGNDAIQYAVGNKTAQKEVGTVDSSTNEITPGDTIISDFEEIIYTLKETFPNSKILYINSSNVSREACENIVYEYSVLQFDISLFNNILGTNAQSHAEIRDRIIDLFTNGNEQWEIIPAIPMLQARYEEIQERINDAVAKYGIEYLDISRYVSLNEDLQSDFVHFNANGYTKLTPYIVEEVERILDLNEEDIPAQVVVHHYLEGTGEEYDNEAVVLSPEVTIDTTIGSQYTTTVGSEVPAKYELVSTPSNATGTIESERMDVYYYYRLKEPSITNETINKTSNTASIDNVNDAISYSIEYKVTVDQYEGNGTVVIVDTLPYEIDEASSKLDGGDYDSTSKTITWRVAVNDIDTYTGGETEEIIVTKNIELKYVNIDVTAENIINEVRGHIELETPEKDSPGVEDTAETPQEYKVSVTVNKEWLDNNDEYGRRPDSLTLILKGNGEEVGRQEIDVAGGESSYTFTNLDRYDEHGYEITYTADEEVTTPDSLDDYSKVIGNIQETGENSKSITITNTIKNIPATVIVRYLEQGTNIELEKQIEINGNVGDEYETEQLEIPGYEFVQSVGNIKGTMTVDTIEVIYYYVKVGKVTVQHIDKGTGELLDEEHVNGRVGEMVETGAKDFEGYVLVESPEDPNVEIEEEEKIVKYYYSKVSAGVLEKHIDDITGELLYSELHEGNEGDSYNIPSREFEGYILVEEKLPTNSTGEMTKELIEVKYYYAKRVIITVEYVDRDTGEKIAEDVIIEGYKGEEYKTEQKEIEGYEFVEIEGETEGILNEDDTITYYYERQKVTEPEPESPENNTNIVDNTIANTVIPQTGARNHIAIIMVITIIIAVIAYIGFKKLEVK